MIAFRTAQQNASAHKGTSLFPLVATAVILASSLLLSSQSWATGPLTGVSTPSVADNSKTASPRALMERLRTIVVLKDTNALLSTIEWPPDIPRTERPMLAKHFIDVFDRFADFNLVSISNEPLGDLTDNADPSIESVGSIVDGTERVPILLRNSSKTPDQSQWRVTASTVQAVQGFEARSEERAATVLRYFPYPELLQKRIAGLATWQWLGATIILFVSVVLGQIISWMIGWTLKSAASRYTPGKSPHHNSRLAIPLGAIIAASVFRVGLTSLGLSIEYRENLLTAAQLLQILFAVLLLIRITTLGFSIYEGVLRRRDRVSATALIPPMRKGVKCIVALIGTLTAIATMGFDVSALLAGLGVGGLAIALAGQKTIENLFGGISVVLDQPVRVGDFGRFGQLVGTVEDIGLRSTRIRTLQRTIVTIPNAEFSQIHIESFAARDMMLFTCTLGVRYETTPAQIALLCDRIKEFLVTHPLVSPEPRRVRFFNLGSSALEIEIFAYIKTADYNHFLEIKEGINLRILELVAEVGTECAFQSVAHYQATLLPLPPEKAAAAQRHYDKSNSGESI
jgi:MscS family membrane protein